MKLVLDVECDSLSEISISGDKIIKEAKTIWCAVAYDIETEKVYRFTYENMHELPDLMDKADLLIGHNILFDLAIIDRLLRKTKCPNYRDSLIISRLMHPDVNEHPLGGNSLEMWGKFLKNPKIEYKGGWDHYSQEMLTYCEQDVMLSAAVYKYQLAWCAAHESILPPAVIKLEHLVSKILAEQTANGFNYDYHNGDILYGTLLLHKVSIEDEMRVVFPDIVHERVSEKTGKQLRSKVEVFNPGSRSQIASRLKDKYNWTPPTTDKGNPKVDEAVLADLNYPEAKKLVEYFNYIKLMGMVLDWNTRANLTRDGHIHGSVNAQGAATGRCTHSQPNMAQVSKDKEARKLWIPDTNCVLVGADLKGLELRMLAHFMAKYDGGKYGEKILTDDIHTYNQKAAGLPDRDAAKTFIYAYCYGAGDKKLGTIVGGNSAAGKTIRTKFQKEIPALEKVHQDVKFSVAKTKGVKLLDGRIVPVRSEHAALNTLLQGSGAVLSKLWMCIANRNLKKIYGTTVKQVAYIHDELQFTCPPEIADAVGKVITEAATDAGVRLGLKIRVDAGYSIGKNWSETH